MLQPGIQICGSEIRLRDTFSEKNVCPSSSVLRLVKYLLGTPGSCERVHRQKHHLSWSLSSRLMVADMISTWDGKAEDSRGMEGTLPEAASEPSGTPSFEGIRVVPDSGPYHRCCGPRSSKATVMLWARAYAVVDVSRECCRMGLVKWLGNSIYPLKSST